MIYGEGTAIVVVIFYRRRQRRGRWRCIFLDRRKRRRHDALDHARHPHGPPGGIDPLHCHDLAREEGVSILAVTAVAYVATVVPEQAREVERDRRSHGMPARSLELHRRLVEPSPVGLFAYPADAEHPVLPRQAHGRPLGVSSADNDVVPPVPTVSSSAVPSSRPTSSLTIPSIWAGISSSSTSSHDPVRITDGGVDVDQSTLKLGETRARAVGGAQEGDDGGGRGGGASSSSPPPSCPPRS